MSGDGTWDYQREAMAAMKLAIAASGFERTRWIRVAQAWQDLGRWVEHPDDAALHAPIGTNAPGGTCPST